MSARAAWSALFACTLIALALARPAIAGPWIPAPGEYYSELRGGLFSADSYHNDDGDRLGLGGKWEERSLLSYTELGWKKTVSFVLAAPLVSATGRDATGSVTDTGLEDILVGLRWGLRQGPSALAAQLDWKTPLGYSRDHSLLAHPLRDGGLQQFTASLLYGTPLAKRGFLQMGAGYGYRFLSITRKGEHVRGSGPNAAKDLWAMPAMASADLGLWVTSSLLVGGRYSGTITASHGDLYPERTVHLAGPLLVYRVDDRLDLVAGSWSTAMANNAPHYDQVYVGVTFKQTGLDRLQGFLGGK